MYNYFLKILLRVLDKIAYVNNKEKHNKISWHNIFEFIYSYDIKAHHD